MRKAAPRGGFLVLLLVLELSLYGQFAFTPACPSAKVPIAADFATANTHAAEVPESLGPAMPSWPV